MWRAFALIATLTVTHAAIFTEGGPVLDRQPSNVEFGEQNIRQTEEDPSGRYEYFEQAPEDDLVKYHELQQNLDFLKYLEQESEKFQSEPEPAVNHGQEPTEQELELILEQLAKIREHHEVPDHGQLEQEEQQPQKVAEQKLPESEPASLPEVAQKEEEKQPSKTSEFSEVPIPEIDDSKKESEPAIPQKKGQSEFVSFVEPVVDGLKQTKSIPTMEKRRLSSSGDPNESSSRYSTSSLLLIAVGTVMSVGIVGTVVGGAYYVKRRNDIPDDGEYAPYAGTGPGFKRNKGNQGDDTLAYKAQLHQYQQAKQKIICGEDAPGVIESDNEEADEENNYSVYECPGLAPTGDIEVCNPNFAAHP